MVEETPLHTNDGKRKAFSNSYFLNLEKSNSEKKPKKETPKGLSMFNNLRKDKPVVSELSKDDEALGEDSVDPSRKTSFFRVLNSRLKR